VSIYDIPANALVLDAMCAIHTTRQFAIGCVVLKQFIDDYIKAHPVFAVWEGVHEYDGMLPDWRKDGIDGEIAQMLGGEPETVFWTK
jgi:hypothetical protein